MARRAHLIEKDIDVERGLLMGQGVNLKDPSAPFEHVYLNWGDLASHMQCYGTTRQGKSRLLAFIARQLIERGDHLCIVEPKGAENQEFLSWITQYAAISKRIKDIRYLSPEHLEDSIKINLLYGLSNDELSSMVQDAIAVDDEFFVDVAAEILGAVLPALTFLDTLAHEYLIEMITRMEYAKVMIKNPIDYANKIMLGDFYDPSTDGLELRVYESMIEEAAGDESIIEKLKIAKLHADNYYKPTSKPNPDYVFRALLTFEDLATFTTVKAFEDLKARVVAGVDRLTKSKMGSEYQFRMANEALRELEKICSSDQGFFSKVTKSYAVTMAKLSTGNVGRILNESKVNTLKDEFYKKDKGIILMVQPFPMRFSKAANMIIKMLMSMYNSLMADVGVSGKKFDKRIHVLVDEAGSVATGVMAHGLANKGGGLGLSLYMFSQSPADYVETLGEDLAKILADNSNTKACFMVNDSTSAELISAMIGSKKRGEITYGANDGQTGRTQSRAVEEALVPPHVISQLPKMTYVLKSGNNVWMMESPYQDDPAIVLDMPSQNKRELVNAYDAATIAEFDREYV